MILKPDPEDGGYNVSCPALPGCHSQGETEDEAIDNIKDAIVGCLEALNQRAIIRNESERLIEVAVG
ncbi:MAG: type II toxin-antitoxin system HicB family antitoxin [Sulfurimonas sp. CG12_big_fil_rev_8_21_14_0_65_36_1453]|nr:MAG: type II toxin-antitoxin system HicB family antitoxin [Sulfurimonas sp. CG12_big_fil_rev_8_21_14_0_65_36_1453]